MYCLLWWCFVYMVRFVLFFEFCFIALIFVHNFWLIWVWVLLCWVDFGCLCLGCHDFLICVLGVLVVDFVCLCICVFIVLLWFVFSLLLLIWILVNLLICLCILLSLWLAGNVMWVGVFILVFDWLWWVALSVYVLGYFGFGIGYMLVCFNALECACGFEWFWFWFNCFVLCVLLNCFDFEYKYCYWWLWLFDFLSWILRGRMYVCCLWL